MSDESAVTRGGLAGVAERLEVGVGVISSAGEGRDVIDIGSLGRAALGEARPAQGLSGEDLFASGLPCSAVASDGLPRGEPRAVDGGDGWWECVSA